MKKITFLLLTIMPLLGISQTFDFTGVDGGWTGIQATLTQNTTSITLDFVTDSDPKLRHNSANVTNTIANGIIAITLKNNSSASEFRFVFDNLEAGSGTVGVIIPITPNTNYFKTYVVDLSADTRWDNNGAGGTQNNIDFAFREPGGTNSNSVDADGSIEIDKVEFISTRPEKTEYTFDNDGDPEGWTDIVDASASVSGGSLVVTPAGAAVAKVTNAFFSVDATANSHVHIVYKNLSSTNNQIRIQFRSSVDNYTAYIGTNVSINQSMAGFETLDIDLQSLKPTEWSGNAQDFQIAVRNTGNGGNAANNDGNFEIESVIFNNSATLSAKDFKKADFTMYPNPAKGMVYLRSVNEIAKVNVYDITGKQVLTTSKLNNEALNISALKTGIYLLQVEDVNQNKGTRKLIKN